MCIRDSDPTVGAATDLDGGGQNDYFLTFSVPFNDVVTQLSGRGITGIDQNSAFAYVIATATQANSLNQDINGVGKTFDPAATWSTLGVVSNSLTADGLAAVPEVKPFLSLAAVLVIVIGHDSLRRRSVRAGTKRKKITG